MTLWSSSCVNSFMLFILNFKTWRGGVGFAGYSAAAAYAAGGCSVVDPTNDPEFFYTTLAFLGGLTASFSSSSESSSSSFLSLAYTYLIYSSY